MDMIPRRINLTGLLVFLVAFPMVLLAQEVKILTTGNKTSLRGISVVDENIVWCSGSNGQVAKTMDGGTTFQWITVKGYEQRDFRDIHAFDSITAVIIAVDTPAIILKTIDGGKLWYKVFEDKRPGMFLDALDFNGRHGMVVGDPIGGKPFLIQSSNEGETWQTQSLLNDCQQTSNGEAFFAASGSNINAVKWRSDYHPLYASGGVQSRLFFMGQCINLPLQSGKDYTGANGLIYSDRLKKGIVIGGDFSDPTRTDSAMVFFELGKEIKVSQPISIPTGYKSGVSFLENGDLLACGTTGVGIWQMQAQKWVQISEQSAHAVHSDKKYRNIYLCGTNGTIYKILY